MFLKRLYCYYSRRHPGTAVDSCCSLFKYLWRLENERTLSITDEHESNEATLSVWTLDPNHFHVRLSSRRCLCLWSTLVNVRVSERQNDSTGDTKYSNYATSHTRCCCILIANYIHRYVDHVFLELRTGSCIIYFRLVSQELLTRIVVDSRFLIIGQIS